MFKTFLFLLILILTLNLTAQNIKSEDITYNFIKLPLKPVSPKVENYNSSITAIYEAENNKLLALFEADKARAEADYQREMSEYPAKIKAADDKYEREMKAWDEKSTALKIVEKQLLNENNRPVKDYVGAPYRKTISPPVLKTSYDYPSLAATYLKIDGYKKADMNALTYQVTLQGFEHSQPMIKSEIKKEVSRVNNVSTTYDVTYYYIEYNFRHPMSVRVANTNNQDVIFLAPTELTEFKTYKSTSQKTSPSADFTFLLKKSEESILKENLSFINHLVNDQIGYEVTPRNSSLDYVKSKNDAHADIMEAYNNQMIGLKSLLTNEPLATQKLNEAVAAYKNILIESDLFDKKARIDKDVTISIHFNLLEAYFAQRKTLEAEAVLDALTQIDLSKREKKFKEKYAAAFLELTNRMAANGL
jgi:hypothetical protein